MAVATAVTCLKAVAMDFKNTDHDLIERSGLLIVLKSALSSDAAQLREAGESILELLIASCSNGESENAANGGNVASSSSTFIRTLVELLIVRLHEFEESSCKASVRRGPRGATGLEVSQLHRRSLGYTTPAVATGSEFGISVWIRPTAEAETTVPDKKASQQESKRGIAERNVFFQSALGSEVSGSSAGVGGIAGGGGPGVHTGQMVCACGHRSGRESYPIDSSRYHLAETCRWNCCSANWNVTTCSSASAAATTINKASGTTSSSFTLGMKILNGGKVAFHISDALAPVRPAVGPAGGSAKAKSHTHRSQQSLPFDEWTLVTVVCCATATSLYLNQILDSQAMVPPGFALSSRDDCVSHDSQILLQIKF